MEEGASNRIVKTLRLAKLNCDPSLDLSFMGLTALSPDISWLSSTLVMLDLIGNRLSSLPCEISSLSHLTTLKLGDNRFTGMPNLSPLPNLDALSMAGNGLTSLPSNIEWPHSLRALILSRNQLSSIPSSVSALSGLHRSWCTRTLSLRCTRT